MVWTHFWDMHSGGGQAHPPFDHIYIEAKEEEAISVFYDRFNHNPHRISCTCCGSDYAITEYTAFTKASAFQRRISKVQSGNVITVTAYKKREDVKIIYAKDIGPDEKHHVLEREGWIWQ